MYESTPSLPTLRPSAFAPRDSRSAKPRTLSDTGRFLSDERQHRPPALSPQEGLRSDYWPVFGFLEILALMRDVFDYVMRDVMRDVFDYVDF